MSEIKFREKYRAESMRLKGYDYSSNGAYFIIICTRNRAEYFGEIRNGIMGLNALGCIAAKFWQEIPMHFKNVTLDAWVIMPDHMHGILILNSCNGGRREKERPATFSSGYFSFISPKPKSVPTIIRSFKSIVSRTIHEDFPEINFGWQTLYYDHIIRNKGAFDRIHRYIMNNPMKWELKRQQNNPQ